MSLDQSHWSCFTSFIFIAWFHIGRQFFLLSCIIARIRGYVYKMPGTNSAILLHLFGYNHLFGCNLTSFINNISLKFIMLKDNNQIFTNCFVVIYSHLTKVSSQINKCIIFEPDELSITLSSLWSYLVPLMFDDLFLENKCVNLRNISHGLFL